MLPMTSHRQVAVIVAARGPKVDHQWRLDRRSAEMVARRARRWEHAVS
jgi:hypothetical protein